MRKENLGASDATIAPGDREVTLPAETALDARLSPEARATLVIGLCFGQDGLPLPAHPFLMRQGVPRRAIDRVFRELEACGYLRRTRGGRPGKLGGSAWRYEFRARPSTA
jgi:hypothetical protein